MCIRDSLRTFAGHALGAAITGCAFAVDGVRLVTSSSDSTAMVWCLKKGELLRAYAGHDGPVTGCDVSPGNRVVTSGADGTVRVWDAGRQVLQNTLRGHDGNGRVTSAAFSPDGRRVLTCGSDGVGVVWEAHHGRKLATLEGHSDLSLIHI